MPTEVLGDIGKMIPVNHTWEQIIDQNRHDHYKGWESEIHKLLNKGSYALLTLLLCWDSCFYFCFCFGGGGLTLYTCSLGPHHVHLNHMD